LIIHLSQLEGHLPRQPNTNPRDHVNVIDIRHEELMESPVRSAQETTPISISARTKGTKEEESLGSNKAINPSFPVHPY